VSVPRRGSDSIALAHDYLLVMRGAERTFAAIADIAPSAPIYTLLYDREGTRGRFATHPVVASRLQHLRLRQGSFRSLLPLYPVAVSTLSTNRYDLVVSSSSAFAHGVPVREGAVHVCYCHTPFRYAWFARDWARDELRPALRPFVDATLNGIRQRDIRIARRVTHYVANSRLCQERILRFWKREAPVVHPPVEVERFSRAEPEDFFLIVSEVIRHKRIPFALEAARRAKRKVVVVGDGPDLPRLRAEYAGIHEFRGRLSDRELENLYPRAKALIVPAVEEFGIAAVESQAAGRPVVGVAAGGLIETVVPGETGELVPIGDVDALAEAIAYVDFDRFSEDRLRQNAERFSVESFRRRFVAEVRRAQRRPAGSELALTA
jgi:glycosyltransferase involved in cell wall biosynthesis